MPTHICELKIFSGLYPGPPLKGEGVGLERREGKVGEGRRVGKGMGRRRVGREKEGRGRRGEEGRGL
jgi:hypothetical protein